MYQFAYKTLAKLENRRFLCLISLPILRNIKLNNVLSCFYPQNESFLCECSPVCAGFVQDGQFIYVLYVWRMLIKKIIHIIEICPQIII
jgi:hypothetical protein